MRWFWIDRFTELVRGQRAAAVKVVSLADEATDHYAPGRPHYPATLIIEGMAQLGGVLVDSLDDFSGRIVLAKIQKSEFFFEVLTGEQLDLRCEIQDVLDIGSFVRGTVYCGDRLQANIDLMFARLSDPRFDTVQLFEPADFCRMLRTLRLFDVGVNEDGTPLKIPDRMLEAEEAYLLNSQ